jgi:hypothetical protein
LIEEEFEAIEGRRLERSVLVERDGIGKVKDFSKQKTLCEQCRKD